MDKAARTFLPFVKGKRSFHQAGGKTLASADGQIGTIRPARIDHAARIQPHQEAVMNELHSSMVRPQRDQLHAGVATFSSDIKEPEGSRRQHVLERILRGTAGPHHVLDAGHHGDKGAVRLGVQGDLNRHSPARPPQPSAQEVRRLSVEHRPGEMHLILGTIVGSKVEAHANPGIGAFAKRNHVRVYLPVAALRREHDGVVSPGEDLPLNEALEKDPAAFDNAPQRPALKLLAAVAVAWLDHDGRPALDLPGGECANRNLTIDGLPQWSTSSEDRRHKFRVNEPTIDMR